MFTTRRLLLIVCILIIIASTVCSEEAAPDPYEPEEFPDWLRSLRRAEIVALGSFPISFFITSLSYGMIRYGINGFSPQYRPWIFAPPNAVDLTTNEKLGVILSAAGLSIIVAVIDLILGASEDTDFPDE
jgi:hypothetical protein